MLEDFEKEYVRYSRYNRLNVSSVLNFPYFFSGVALTRYMDGRTDGQGDSYIPPQTLFAGGITINEGTNGKRLKKYGKFSTDETFSLL
jgi:hypothetical protein